MTFQLTLTTSTLLNWHEQLEREPASAIRWPLGLSLHAERTTWLVPTRRDVAADQATGPLLRVVACRSNGELARLRFSARSSSDRPVVLLGIGCENVSGHLAACYIRNGHALSIGDIRLIGSEVENVTDPESLGTIVAHHDATEAASHSRFNTWAPTREALGEETWQRFKSQNFGVVGAGRMGSSVAELLHRNGAKVTVVDADRFEPHNLGESALAAPSDVTRSKALVIRDRLQNTSPGTQPVRAVLHSVLSLAALPAVKDCTILISAVDNPTARLVIAFLSVIYMIPVCDLGTGIFHRQRERTIASESEHDRDMGADIRLCLPGRCLLCTGGIQALDTAVRELQAIFAGRTTGQNSGPSWFEQRSGSLRSLNGCAVNLGLRLIEDWLAHTGDAKISTRSRNGLSIVSASRHGRHRAQTTPTSDLRSTR